jgi:hypothetical protein
MLFEKEGPSAGGLVSDVRHQRCGEQNENASPTNLVV